MGRRRAVLLELSETYVKAVETMGDEGGGVVGPFSQFVNTGSHTVKTRVNK